MPGTAMMQKGARAMRAGAARASMKDARRPASAPAPRSVKMQSAQTAFPSTELKQPGVQHTEITRVYKFGGSSVRDAERMREVARIVCSLPEDAPALVLSAMGITTNLLLEAGEEAIACKGRPKTVRMMEPLVAIKKLHRESCNELGVDMETREEIEGLLEELEQLLTGICLLQELTDRARDSLVSFGERMSTRIFAAFLRAEGVPARQWDAMELGFVSSDDFLNAQIDLPATYEIVAKNLKNKGPANEIPIVTGFLAKGKETGAITTLGRGGSDLSATVLGAALGLDEVYVWKDVDGVLTTDPRLIPSARPVPFLTFDEATELAYFGATVLHPASMRPAIESGGKLNVRVKNSYNTKAPGTLISAERDMSESLLSSVVLKRSITMVDVSSTRMLGQYGFLAKVFDIFQRQGISVDVVATSEVSVSLTLDAAKIWSRDLAEEELDNLVAAFDGVAEVHLKKSRAIVSLVANVERSSEVLSRVFHALDAKGINAEMISQGASKTNISLVVEDYRGVDAVKAIHEEFYPESDGKGGSWVAQLPQ